FRSVSCVLLFSYFLINFIFVFCISFVYFGLFLLRVSLTKKKIDGNILFYKKVWGYCSFFFCIFLRNFYRVVFFSLFYNNHNKISSLLYVELLIFLKKLTIRLNIFVSLG